MRLVIQRVIKASVSVEEKVVGKIDKGLFVLIGIKKGDTQKEVEFLASKLVKLRILSDMQDKMNLSLIDTKQEVLAVSQFTLYADTKGGNRPSFLEAEEPDKARSLYEFFVDRLKNSGIKVETGSFGEYMKIEASLDGPVTIFLES